MWLVTEVFSSQNTNYACWDGRKDPPFLFSFFFFLFSFFSFLSYLKV